MPHAFIVRSRPACCTSERRCPLNATDFLTGRYANDAADRHTIDGEEI
ncbi:hypothetical protein [Streptomyces sp. NPDC006739]